MRKAHIYVEGGSVSNKAVRTSCQSGFSEMLKNSGYADCMPKITSCGSRKEAYNRFIIAHTQANKKQEDIFIALLVDSEDPVNNISEPWKHLKEREFDKWDRPIGASDDQVLLMTTCMETWIVADRNALQEHYHADQRAKAKRRKQEEVINQSQLPSLSGLETQHRHDVQEKLERATSNCSNKYTKGKRSFEPLGKLDHCTLMNNLASFRRMIEILDRELECQHTPCPDE